MKSNLVKEERTQLLKRFTEKYFKTVAKARDGSISEKRSIFQTLQVVMGEPPASFKEKA